MRNKSIAVLLAFFLFLSLSTFASPKQLTVSENGRYLVFSDGTSFFYLGDTAWELFHRLDREEAVTYLENRAEKGFTVIQAVVLAERDGLDEPNAYGDKALIDKSWIKAEKRKEIWYDTRYGVFYPVHTGDTAGIQTYTPPTSGRGHDWLFIIEDPAINFPLP